LGDEQGREADAEQQPIELLGIPGEHSDGDPKHGSTFWSQPALPRGMDEPAILESLIGSQLCFTAGRTSPAVHRPEPL